MTTCKQKTVACPNCVKVDEIFAGLFNNSRLTEDEVTRRRVVIKKKWDTIDNHTIFCKLQSSYFFLIRDWIVHEKFCVLQDETNTPIINHSTWTHCLKLFLRTCKLPLLYSGFNVALGRAPKRLDYFDRTERRKIICHTRSWHLKIIFYQHRSSLKIFFIFPWRSCEAIALMSCNDAMKSEITKGKWFFYAKLCSKAQFKKIPVFCLK